MKRLSRLLRATRRFLSRRQNRIAVALVGVFMLVSAAAPALAPPADPAHPGGFRVVGRKTDLVPHPPGPNALLGTGAGQIDIFYSVVWGARSALRFGLIAASTAAAFGVLAGLFAGFVGGPVGGVLMRITDAFLTFPSAAGALLFTQLIYPPNPWDPPTSIQRAMIELEITPVMIALIVFSWMPYARIIAASVTQLMEADFVLAARAVGARRRRIMFRHVLPNVISPAIVLVARDIGGLVILEAAFTFIGFSGIVEWGAVLVQNRSWIIGTLGNPFTYWWVYLPPTLALLFFAIGWNLLGDGLNDALNPRSER